MEVAYETLCPVCQGKLTQQEIEKNLCFKTKKPLYLPYEVKELKEFEKFFGKKLRKIQRLWAKRVLRHESFAIEAPTGTGKSSFGIKMSEYLASKGKKCYIIVPTTNLVKQTYEKISNSKAIAYHKDLKNKEEVLNNISQGGFSILITTATFLVKHYDKIKHQKFDFIFVDDLDAVLKGSKNIDKIISLLGYSQKEIAKGQEYLQKIRKYKGILVIATATSKPGSATVKLREVLGIDASSSRHALRNIVDVGYATQNYKKAILELINFLEDGIIVYTNTEEEAKKLYAYLEEHKIKVGKAENIEEFKEGKINVLIGISAPYGKLVRGLDLPKRVKYALFYKIPHFKINLKEEITDNLVKVLLGIFRNHPSISSKYYSLLNNLEEAKALVKKILLDPEKEKYVIKGVVIKKSEIIIPDLKTYIQASGRTSRMYAGGLTKGLSIIVDEEKHLDAFKIKAMFYDIDIKDINHINLQALKQEIEEERKNLDKIKISSKEMIFPALMVVESPTKAKQISRFFGKPAIRLQDNQIFYEIFTGKYVLIITASLGHVVDLITKKYFHGVEVNKKIIPHYDSIKKCPNEGIQFVDEDKQCEEIRDSKLTINNIRKNGYDAELIIIATDPDTEGEKIAKDIRNLDSFVEIKRAEFHEVTKPAIIEALNNLREIHENLVDAQIVRRVEDRWIGFELSKKVQQHFKQKNLSAGRVQTPVLGWIIDAYEKSKQKKKEYYLIIENAKIKIDKELQEGEYEAEIIVKEKREKELTPLPPYSTDEALKDINRILKIDANNAMKILQKLFENGLITYHRTDSTRVSEKGLEIAKMYLQDDFVGRTWEEGSEGAHECIRPTKPLTKQDLLSLLEQNILRISDELTSQDLSVYDLIFRRFMASQAKKIKVEEEKYIIEINKQSIEHTAITKYEGKAYELYPYIGIPIKLPEGVHKVLVESKLVPITYPLTQAELIKLMKERKIGRPSTYATIINKILTRKYAVEKSSFLIPTPLGIKVYNFLTSHYKKYVSEETTQKIYEIMDLVEQGKIKGEEVLWQLYHEIKNLEHEAIKTTL
ncbi:MAG: reverse gyrase [Candidatus Nanohaloarchaeota archaeon]|nr:reverse gyrase [Candidatus Nanohaloarchaeota archaeon]